MKKNIINYSVNNKKSKNSKMIDSCKKDTHNTPETYVVKAMIVYPDVSIGGIKMESTMKLQLKNKENVVHAMLLPLFLP